MIEVLRVRGPNTIKAMKGINPYPEKNPRENNQRPYTVEGFGFRNPKP